GSNTHNGDLESIVRPLAAFLEDRPDVRLLLVGHLQLPRSLGAFKGRILCVPYQHHLVYPWLMARCRALLAPIEHVNEFTNAKSALKIFEGGIFGVPAIASPTACYIAAIEEGRSGFVARSDAEWVDALRRLSDPVVSRHMGDRARTMALSEHSPDRYLDMLAIQLMAHNGPHYGGTPPLRPLDTVRGQPDSSEDWPANVPPESSRSRFAQECLDVNAPIVHRVAAAQRDGSRLVLGGKNI